MDSKEIVSAIASLMPEVTGAVADTLEQLADLLEKHGSIEQIRLLCEAGEKLGLTLADGSVWSGDQSQELWEACRRGDGSTYVDGPGTFCLASSFGDYYDPHYDTLSNKWPSKEAALKALNTEGE